MAGYAPKKSWPQSQRLLRTCASTPHFGHFFLFHALVHGFLAFDFRLRSACFCSLSCFLRGSSACCIAHCGWIPPGEYDGEPHTGQVFSPRRATAEFAVLEFMMTKSLCCRSIPRGISVRAVAGYLASGVSQSERWFDPHFAAPDSMPWARSRTEQPHLKWRSSAKRASTT